MHPSSDLARNSQISLLLLAASLCLAILTLSQLERNVNRLDELRRIERNRAIEAQDELRKRSEQLDGALETITELKGGQPASASE